MKVKIQPLLLNHNKEQQFSQKFLLLQNIVKANNFQREIPNRRNCYLQTCLFQNLQQIRPKLILLLKIKMKTFMRQLVVTVKLILMMKSMQSCLGLNQAMIEIKILMQQALLISFAFQKNDTKKIPKMILSG